MSGNSFVNNNNNNNINTKHNKGQNVRWDANNGSEFVGWMDNKQSRFGFGGDNTQQQQQLQNQFNNWNNDGSSSSELIGNHSNHSGNSLNNDSLGSGMMLDQNGYHRQQLGGGSLFHQSQQMTGGNNWGMLNSTGGNRMIGTETQQNNNIAHQPNLNMNSSNQIHQMRATYQGPHPHKPHHHHRNQQQHQHYEGGGGGDGISMIQHQQQIGQQIGLEQSQQGQRQYSNNGGQMDGIPGGRGYAPAGTGGSNAQGRALNKMLLEILRERIVDPNRLAMAIDANIERMDCVNLATLLFHTGKKRLLLTPAFIKRIAVRFNLLKEELRAREASNALYGLKCMSSECVEVRLLIHALAIKVQNSTTELVAQAVGNALYGCQMMTSDHEEVRYMLNVLAIKVGQCNEPLEAQNVGNALYGLRGMNSDCKEVRALLVSLTPKVAGAREDLNGQALGNSLYGMQGMSSRETEVCAILNILAIKASQTWENLKAQEVGNALYGLKRMNSDVADVRALVEALVPKIASSPEILDAQAIGNSFYGMQCMKSDNVAVLTLLATMAEKVTQSHAELDGQAMGNSLYGLQGMSSEHSEVRAVVTAITMKIQSSYLEMNAQELGNALYGLQNMTSSHQEVRNLMTALTIKVSSSKHELTSQEIGNALFGLQGMRSDVKETRILVKQMAIKIQQSHSLIDPQGVANSLFGMQSMSSDCEEVRLLVNALAIKIEQSWKLLSANHLRNSMFGIQGLSSSEIEIRSLIHSLVPKVLACRDELTAKHVCNIIFGIKNLSSEHEESRSLIGAITDKVVHCVELFSLKSLSCALFGLQGLSSSYSEVRLLVGSIVEKISPSLDDINILAIGNCFFGLQRMDTLSQEVCALLNIIAPLFITALFGCNYDACAQVIGNVLCGIQKCSCTEDSIRNVLYAILGKIKEIVTEANSNKSSHHVNEFVNIISVYQALSIALQSFPDLHLDDELRSELLLQQALLLKIVELRKGEVKSSSLRTADVRLAECLMDTLIHEPFNVITGELLFGFEAGVVVTLKPDIKLVTVTGELWNPKLFIEVEGPSCKVPANELFITIRNKYLRESHKVVVHTVSSTLFNNGHGLADILRTEGGILNSLYPPTLEDSTNFAQILSSIGLTNSGGILSSLNTDENNINDANNSSKYILGSSFFSSTSLDSLNVSPSKNEFNDPSQEYAVDFFDSRQSLPISNSLSVKFLGVGLGWLGDQPTVKTSTQSRPGILPAVGLGISLPSTHTGGFVVSMNATGKQILTPHIENAIGSKSPITNVIENSYNSIQTTPSSLHQANSPNISRTLNNNIEFPSSSNIIINEDTDNILDPPAEVDSELELLQAQLEIARIEARILLLKKSKTKSQSNTPTSTPNKSVSFIFQFLN
jgi:hypothetical protein